MPWSYHDLAAAFADRLRRREVDLCAEQAVHGLDSLPELALHPVLAEGAEGAGMAVFRETPYPGQPQTLPRESERERCDLVIAPGGALAIADSIRKRKERGRADGTLFATVAEREDRPAPGEVLPTDALWIEVKTIGQFTYVDGLAGPNRTYASQFGACLADVHKLARARDLANAGLLIVHFSEHAAVAVHDLTAFVHRCLDRDLPATDLYREHVEIADRIGNRLCTVGLVPVRCAGVGHAGTEA